MQKIIYYIGCVMFFLCCKQVSAQQDSGTVQKNPVFVSIDSSSTSSSRTVKNTSFTTIYNPRKATMHSLILPGWGQAYNHQYWKIPFVYAAIGTTVGLFIYNFKNYKRTKYAYTVAYNIQNRTDMIGSPTYNAVDDDLKPFLAFPEALRAYRNSFRQSMDYSGLFFLLAWGLNVIDATVSAHLKTFDVSDDLSLQIVPGYSNTANTTGVSLVVNIK